MATIAVFLVLSGGTAVALSGSNTVFSDDIVNNQVSSADTRDDTLANGGLQAVDLRPGSVGTSEVAANSLNGSDINESGLGIVPNANQLDGIDSTGFVQTIGGTIQGALTVHNGITSGSHVLADGEVQGLSVRALQHIQLPTVSTAPPPNGDCDEGSEAGRAIVRTDGTTNLYLCLGTGGWVGK
jgi:hypothetical protein